MWRNCLVYARRVCIPYHCLTDLWSVPPVVFAWSMIHQMPWCPGVWIMITLIISPDARKFWKKNQWFEFLQVKVCTILPSWNAEQISWELRWLSCESSSGCSYHKPSLVWWHWQPPSDSNSEDSWVCETRIRLSAGSRVRRPSRAKRKPFPLNSLPSALSLPALAPPLS